MTRLLTCGWETGDLAEAGVLFGTAPVLANSAPSPRAGNYYMKWSTSAGFQAYSQSWKQFSMLTALTNAWVRFGLYFHEVDNQEICISQWMDSAGNPQVSLNLDTSSGTFRIRNANYNGTVIGSS